MKDRYSKHSRYLISALPACTEADQLTLKGSGFDLRCLRDPGRNVTAKADLASPGLVSVICVNSRLVILLKGLHSVGLKRKPSI